VVSDETGTKTYFAPAEKADREQLTGEREHLRNAPFVRDILDSYPEPAAIVNDQRQIVLANKRLTALVGKGEDELLGARPGEALACVNSDTTPAGCGTSRECRYCGAVQAIQGAIVSREEEAEECRMTVGSECQGRVSLDLKVWATPLTVEAGRYTIISVQDITDDKRRQVLERMFFHDAINVAGGLQGLTDLLLDSEGDEARELTLEIRALTHQLVEEIQCQRDLAAAERGDLEADVVQIEVAELLSQVLSTYENHSVAEGRRIDVAIGDAPPRIQSDPVLLRRVLGNLVKNALEASRYGQSVTLRYEMVDGEPAFLVHNKAVMTEEIKAQVFQRSFSTRGGKGRGVGTYSVRTLTERYLGGSVTFSSEEGRGTEFVVRLPQGVAASA
jgi:K+-sensing histidine kinase KdpD